jgi:hypothetical protein
MNKLFAAAVVFAAFLSVPSAALAGDNSADRSAAIQLCRTEVAAQAGADADAVRLDNVRVRPSQVRVDFDLWRDGQLQNVRCDVSRDGDTLQIASITPALQTASAASTSAR